MELLDPLSVKYFKMVVEPKSIKKDTPTEVQANCPLCGDKKYRLHLYRPKGFTKDVTHCFNAGCILEEKHHSILNFLKLTKPELVPLYKRENLDYVINEIKGNDPQSVLESIEKVTDKRGDPEIPLHRFFKKCKDSDACKGYVKHRGFQPKDDWYYSEDEFFEYNNKKVYLKDYLIIPIYNNGKYKGFYSRSIKEKKFSTFLLPDTEKVWMCDPFLEPQDLEILCEGIFDSLSSGFQKCGAMLSASLSKEFMDKLNPECIIALDNDETGIKKSIKYIEEGFRVFVPPDDWNYKDFNDAKISGVSSNEIKKIIEENSYKGILGLTKLKMKEI